MVNLFMHVWVYTHIWMYKFIYTETGSNYTMQIGLKITVQQTGLKCMIIKSRISELCCVVVF